MLFKIHTNTHTCAHTHMHLPWGGNSKKNLQTALPICRKLYCFPKVDTQRVRQSNPFCVKFSTVLKNIWRDKGCQSHKESVIAAKIGKVSPALAHWHLIPICSILSAAVGIWSLLHSSECGIKLIRTYSNITRRYIKEVTEVLHFQLNLRIKRKCLCSKL